MSNGLDSKVRDLIAEQLGVAAEQVTLDANLVSDLGADSLDVVEFILALEDALNIEIDDEEAQKLFTVGDVLAFIEAKGASLNKRR